MPTLAPLDDVMELLAGVWSRGIMTHNGPLVQQFEKEVADFLHIKNVVAVANGTIAIQMAIRALGLKGEIITTPFTFIATVSSIIWEGCTPVFVDIDPETLNIDVNKIEQKINKHTCAILPVHVFGNCCDIESIEVIAEKYKLKVIYDAAHSVGVQYKNKSVFDFGDISVTSFHATKMLNTAEGGACFSCDDELHKKLQRIRFFGFDEYKEVIDDGFNGKMTEVHAAVGLANLKLLDAALKDRKEKYSLYMNILSQNTAIKFQKINEGCNYSYFPVILPSEDSVINVEQALKQESIYPRRYFSPSLNTCTYILPYNEMPVSEDISKRILCLPLYYSLEKNDIKRISDIVLNVLKIL
jgi:dTDP-4-amino-4,6-dideoxygalactose transaminase